MNATFGEVPNMVRVTTENISIIPFAKIVYEESWGFVIMHRCSVAKGILTM